MLEDPYQPNGFVFLIRQGPTWLEDDLIMIPAIMPSLSWLADNHEWQKREP